MMRSGITTNAQRKDNRGNVVWQEVDIVDLSDEEFANFWISVKEETQRFVLANTLRQLCHRLSDFGDEFSP